MPSIGESKQGFIITIVILSLLVVALGVTTYLGYSGQTALAETVKKAATDTNTMKASRDWERFKALALLAFSGYASKDEYSDLSGAYVDYDAKKLGKDEKDRNEFAANLEKLQNPTTGLGWNNAARKPEATFLDQVKKLGDEVGHLTAQLEAARKDFAAKVEEERGLRKTAENDKAVLVGRLAETEAKLASLVNTKSTGFTELTEMVAERDKEIVGLKKEGRSKADEDQRRIAQLTHQVGDQQKVNDKLRDQITPVDQIKLDQPRGKVTSVTSGFVYINLGSADSVKPGLTFSVFGVGTDGKAEGERKGGIEVVSVLDTHLSMCRVLEVADPGRYPILTADQIFNPSWSPGLRQHVAITGLVDLTGDGRDNTLQFVRDLERQGVIVDAYLDLRDVTIKGRGVTGQTSYLVLGEMPQFNVGESLGAGANAERKKEIATRMSELQTDANRLGVQIVPARRFLTMIGYRMPRSVTPADYDSTRPAVLTDESGTPTGKEGAREGKTDLREPASRDQGDMEGKDADKEPAKGKPKGKPTGKKASVKPKDEDKDKGDDDKP